MKFFMKTNLRFFGSAQPENTGTNEGDKKFTQKQLDGIIEARLARERVKLFGKAARQDESLGEQPAELAEQPANLTAQPAGLEAQTANPAEQLADLAAQPANLTAQPAGLEQTANPAEQPTDLMEQLADLTAQPTDLETQTANPAEQPTDLTEQPTSPAVRPATPASTPPPGKQETNHLPPETAPQGDTKTEQSSADGSESPSAHVHATCEEDGIPGLQSGQITEPDPGHSGVETLQKQIIALKKGVDSETLDYAIYLADKQGPSMGFEAALDKVIALNPRIFKKQPIATGIKQTKTAHDSLDGLKKSIAEIMGIQF